MCKIAELNLLPCAGDGKRRIAAGLAGASWPTSRRASSASRCLAPPSCPGLSKNPCPWRNHLPQLSHPRESFFSIFTHSVISRAPVVCPCLPPFNNTWNPSYGRCTVDIVSTHDSHRSFKIYVSLRVRSFNIWILYMIWMLKWLKVWFFFSISCNGETTDIPCGGNIDANGDLYSHPLCSTNGYLAVKYYWVEMCTVLILLIGCKQSKKTLDFDHYESVG